MNNTKKASHANLIKKKKAWHGVLKIDASAATKLKIILLWP